jgi:hypothetical protein
MVGEDLFNGSEFIGPKRNKAYQLEVIIQAG